MTIITQDGRKLELNPENRIECGTSTIFDSGGKTYSSVCVAELVQNTQSETIAVKFREDIGTFENSHAHLVCQALTAMLKKGVKEFNVPQLTSAEQNSINAYQLMDETIEKCRLIQATAEEIATGLERIGSVEYCKAIHLAKETDYWERRNVIVIGKYGDRFKSFAKWQALKNNPSPTVGSAGSPKIA